MDDQFISSLKEIIITAGEIAINLRNNGLIIEKKSDNSPVTNADLAISNLIYSALTNLNKNIPIICEEQPLKDISNNEIIWLVDPIDGTRSYIRNMDSFTVNIALIKNKIPIIGLIYQPTLHKLYFTDHRGKFCIEQNGQTLAPIKRNNDNYIAVVSSRNFNLKTEQYIKNNNFSEIIAIPSSIKLCMVAEGSADVYPKFGPTMEWDIAAGHALVNSAGGIIIDNHTSAPLSYTKIGFKNTDFLALAKRFIELKKTERI